MIKLWIYLSRCLVKAVQDISAKMSPFYWTTLYIWRGTPRRVSGLRKDPTVSAEDPTPIHTSHWNTDSEPLVAASVRVTSNSSQPAQNPQGEGRSLFFSGMCRSVWGLLRRLRGPYVIPRPGVYQAIFIPAREGRFTLKFSGNDSS